MIIVLLINSIFYLYSIMWWDKPKSNMKNYEGIIRGVKFLIKNERTIKIWKPSEIDVEEFKPLCDLVVRYLIDEGFFKRKQCRVEIVY